MSTLVSRIKKEFQPKINKEMDYSEEVRYILSYRMTLLWIGLFGILTLLFAFLFDPMFAILTGLAFIGTTVSFLFIKKTGKYQKFILGFNLFAAILCQYTMFALPEQPHIADGFWMMVNIVFAFLTIPKVFAYSITFIHIFGLTIFYSFFYNNQIHLLQEVSGPQVIGIGLNIVICFIILTYLTVQNINITKKTQNKLFEVNKNLAIKNAEKTLMLKEIHHRVKNNLQIVISLLRLQSNEMDNEEAILKFKETTNRVISMSLAHEKMYQSDDLSELNLKDYFSALANDMILSYDKNGHIDYEVDCDIYTKDIKSIVPIGLLINELISNSMKHAFKDNSKGIISIKTATKDNQLLITYSDNGTWIEPKSTSSFGMELIDTLCEQLAGTKKLTFEPTSYHFEFPTFLD